MPAPVSRVRSAARSRAARATGASSSRARPAAVSSTLRLSGRRALDGGGAMGLHLRAPGNTGTTAPRRVRLAGTESRGDGSVRLASAAGRWVLAVAVLGDAMILLEATVVNVSLPAIGRDLGAGVAGLQWTLNGYVLTLAALVLVCGSLSDT